MSNSKIDVQDYLGSEAKIIEVGNGGKVKGFLKVLGVVFTAAVLGHAVGKNINEAPNSAFHSDAPAISAENPYHNAAYVPKTVLKYQDTTTQYKAEAEHVIDKHKTEQHNATHHAHHVTTDKHKAEQHNATHHVTTTNKHKADEHTAVAPSGDPFDLDNIDGGKVVNSKALDDAGASLSSSLSNGIKNLGKSFRTSVKSLSDGINSNALSEHERKDSKKEKEKSEPETTSILDMDM